MVIIWWPEWVEERRILLSPKGHSLPRKPFRERQEGDKVAKRDRKPVGLPRVRPQVEITALRAQGQLTITGVAEWAGECRRAKTTAS